jgi:hypothetical protein
MGSWVMRCAMPTIRRLLGDKMLSLVHLKCIRCVCVRSLPVDELPMYGCAGVAFECARLRLTSFTSFTSNMRNS